MTSCRRSPQQAERWGRLAETIAAWFLRVKGYRILGRRLRTPFGELDMIAWRRGMFVFVEVKARQTMNEGVDALTSRQQGRIRRAADYYLGHRSLPSDYSVRFDLIVILPKKIPIHLVNAW